MVAADITSQWTAIESDQTSPTKPNLKSSPGKHASNVIASSYRLSVAAAADIGGTNDVALLKLQLAGARHREELAIKALSHVRQLSDQLSESLARESKLAAEISELKLQLTGKAQQQASSLPSNMSKEQQIAFLLNKV